MEHSAYENVTRAVKMSPNVGEAAKAWLSTYLSALMDEDYLEDI